MTAPVSRDELWQTLGRLASGVSVITAAGGERRGMTAAAVTAVSHDPPMLAVAVKQDHAMHAVLAGSGLTRFGVNVLSSTQKALAEHFAGKPGPVPTLPWFEHEGLPLLGGTIAQVVCRLSEAVPLGDHTLFVGIIEYSRFTDDDPLVAFRGQYHELG